MMLFFCCQVVFYPTRINAQESKDRFDIEFEDKISFYLNQQTRAFYKDMLVKEKLLLQMIYNVNEEFKRRGLKLATEEQIPAEVFFEYSDRLIAEYNQEIDLLQQTIDKTGQLEQVSGSEESLKALVRLQRQLDQILEDRGMFKPASYPRSILVKLIKAYNRELDTVLHLYDVFEDLEHKVKNDSLLHELKQQKDLIAQVLDFHSRPVEQDSILTQYAEEVKRLNKVLNQIELLKFRTSGSHMQVFYALEELRNQVLSQLDENLAALLSEPEPQPRRISVFEIFNEWKTKEIAAYSASLTKYQIIRGALLQTATPAEKDRMLENDLKNALISHANEDFEVAEKQFTQILLEYPGYERRFASLYFYRAESFFARNLLIKAVEDY